MTMRTRPVVLAGLVALVGLAVSGGCGPRPGDGPGDQTAAEAQAAVLPVESSASIALIEVPAAPGAMAPELTLIRTGEGRRAALTWLEPVAEDPATTEGRSAPAERPSSDAPSWRLRFARLEDPAIGRWSDPVTIAPTDGARFFANWADRPAAVQGSATPGAEAPLYAHWLAMNGESVYTYEVRVARSADGGRTWRQLGRLHGDATPAEHGFVSYVPDAERPGGVRAFWLDGGPTVDGAPMTLRTVRLAEEVDRASEELLDDSVCDCCSTTGVITPAGTLVVYRDRTGDEIRDPWMVRGGAGAWSAPEPLHRDGWTIPACPVNGPVAGVAGDTVWVAWFTAEGGRPRVLAAVSGDGGLTFAPPVTIDADGPLGRLDLVVDGSAALVSWLDTADDEAVIRLRRMAADGRLGPPVDVARAAGGRSSGVPRLLAVSPDEAGEAGDRLLVAWVDPGDDERPRSLRLASLNAAEVPAPSDASADLVEPAEGEAG